MPVERLAGVPDSSALSALSAPRRLAVGLFLALLVAFYACAQVQILAAVGRDGAYPGPHEVLVRYHGDPTRSRLHKVLDPALGPEDAKNMYVRLGAEEERPARRALLLGWVERGMPRSEWPRVAPVFTGVETCAGCHAPGAPKADLPFDTYEHVVAGAGMDTGMSLYDIATSSHNHLMAFSVLALLVSLVFTATRWRGPIVTALVAGAFGGAALDVASWWLTRAHGHPWEFGVLAGGGAYGTAVMTMVALSLDELWLRGAVGGVLLRALAPLRLARREGG